MWNQGKRRSLRGRGSVGRKAHEIDEMTICHFDVYREWKDGRRVLVRMMMVVPRRARERLQGKNCWPYLENTREPSRCYLGLHGQSLSRNRGVTSRAFPLAEGAQGP